MTGNEMRLWKSEFGNSWGASQRQLNLIAQRISTSLNTVLPFILWGIQAI